MHINISRKTIAGTLLTALMSLGGWAQETAVSPYSIFGNGDLETASFAQQTGMGGWSAAMRNPLQVNLSNPASLSALKFTSIELGAFFQHYIQTDGVRRHIASTGGLDYLSVGFGILDNWGMAVAMIPYSRLGYNVETRRNFGAFGDGDQLYSGVGGFDRITMGHGIEIFRGLSLGVNGSFIFGNTQRNTSVYFDDDAFYNTRREETIRATGFSWDAGIQYRFPILPQTELIFGASYSPTTNLQGDFSDLYFTFTENSLGMAPRDTVYNIAEQSRDVKFSSYWSAGFSIGKSHPNLNQHAWSLGADFVQLNRAELNSADVQGEYTNGWRVSVGGQVLPYYAADMSRGSYFSQIDYRLGGFYKRSGLVLGGMAINDYGISAGLGLPLGRRTLTASDVKLAMLNFGMVIGNRGTVEGGNIQEQYIQLVLGITLNDKWFTQFKYR